MSGEGEMFRTKPAEASYSMASEPAKQIGSEPLRASYAALIGFSAKELPIGIFDPARQQFSIRTGKGVLQVEQACDQARRTSRTPGFWDKEGGPACFKDRAVD